jgi:AcrR family transcriptional regulator
MFARASDVRNKVERTAIRLFAERGVDATSTKQITQAAGVSEGALFRHWKTKDDLIWDLFSRHYLAFTDRLDRICDQEIRFDWRIEAVVREVCRFYDEDPDLFRFLLLVQHGQLTKIAAGTRTPVNVLAEIIEDGQAAGDLPQTDVVLKTAMVLGIMLQSVTFHVYGSVIGPMSAQVPHIAAACIATAKV